MTTITTRPPVAPLIARMLDDGHRPANVARIVGVSATYVHRIAVEDRVPAPSTPVALDLPSGWMADAACAGRPGPWDAESHADVRAALTVCARCPVMVACRNHADRASERGVWGGELRDDRGRPVTR